jgi:hypothetical protein
MKKGFEVFASILSATPDDAEGLASWLAEREERKEIMNMKVDSAKQNNERLSVAAEEYDGQIAVSQIRILSKRYTNDPDVVPYVAVLDKWDDEMWLIAPFSPYRTPATDGEMATGLDVYGLNVIQAWNGRTVQNDILKNSYLFGSLDEKVRKDALSLFRHEFAGVGLPTDFSAKRGSIILDASDPRRDYLRECIARLQPLSDAVIEYAECGDVSRREWWEGVEGRAVLNGIFEKYISNQECRLAAATDDGFPHVPVLMCKDAWDAMIEGIEISGFSGFYPGEDGRNLIFELQGELPCELEGKDGLTVNAYMRETRQLIGSGMLIRLDQGGAEIVVELCAPDINIAIEGASDLVLVVDVK